MSQQNQDFLSEGLKAQHTIYERLTWKINGMPRYDIFESPEGSPKDLVDKIDITLIDKLTNKEYNYDVKSSQYCEKITYTHINSLGQKSKIYSGDFSIDLIFTFGTYNIGYFVRAEEFYNLLQEKIKNGKEYNSKTKINSKYVWITLEEIKALAYNTI